MATGRVLAPPRRLDPGTFFWLGTQRQQLRECESSKKNLRGTAEFSSPGMDVWEMNKLDKIARRAKRVGAPFADWGVPPVVFFS